jgi:hypothetical protein
MHKVDLKTQIVERLETLQHTGGNGTTQTATQPTGDAPRVAKAQGPAFYELDRYAKLRDPLMIIAMGLVLYGVSQYSMPVMFILAGVLVFALSWMMAR